MLVRAYRLTDKLGVVFLKGSIALVDTTLEGLGILWRGAAALLIGIGRILWIVLGPIFNVIVGLLLFLVNGVLRLTGNTAVSARRTGSAAMARRAARAELEATLTQDPLRAQNRTLSVLSVLLLAALVGAVLWATNPSRSGGVAVADTGGIANAALFANTPLPETQVPSLLATPVPTVTPLPAVLQVRGSLSYVVRESGQTDIWAVPVGTRTPIRLTNSPADERDPVWSPDGRRLAYASRQDGNWDIYIYDLAANTTTRMTYDLGFQAGPGWSPDGRWLVYENYVGGNLDVYVMPVEGNTGVPQRLPGNSDAPDFSPAWSPLGRQIAFVSWRDGNQDIYVFSLDDQSVTNVTNTPLTDEDHPSWSPNGELLAFSAVDVGREKVFVKSVENLASPSQVLDSGRAPTWSPDGTSLVFTVDSFDSTQLIASPFATSAGVVTTIIPVPLGASDPTWTSTPLPQALVNAGGLPAPITTPLYIEQEDGRNTDPAYRLNPIPGVTVEDALLSDRVNDSFNALREAALEQGGWDFLGRLDDAFWRIERPPQPGEEVRSWLKTGRAFGITRSGILGSPAPLEIVREDLGVNTLWRVFVRVSQDAQAGQLGEPLRRMPWDFASRTQGDVQAYDEGGRLKRQVPEGYYMDFTLIARDYGWDRVPAGNDWRANANSINYWLFRKADGLDWFSAMRELYTVDQLGGFAPTATPFVAPPEGATQPSVDLVLPTQPPAAENAIPTQASVESPVDTPLDPTPTIPLNALDLLTPQSSETGDQG
jgi:TolB protein